MDSRWNILRDLDDDNLKAGNNKIISISVNSDFIHIKIY